jgi:hypothetical protein
MSQLAPSPPTLPVALVRKVNALADHFDAALRAAVVDALHRRFLSFSHHDSCNPRSEFL